MGIFFLYDYLIFIIPQVPVNNSTFQVMQSQFTG